MGAGAKRTEKRSSPRRAVPPLKRPSVLMCLRGRTERGAKLLRLGEIRLREARWFKTFLLFSRFCWWSFTRDCLRATCG